MESMYCILKSNEHFYLTSRTTESVGLGILLANSLQEDKTYVVKFYPSTKVKRTMTVELLT